MMNIREFTSHHDVLVILSIVACHGLNRMLIDNGNPVNILLGSVFDQILTHGPICHSLRIALLETV